MALVSQTEFSKLAGVSQPAIAKAAKSGLLSVDGKKIDTNGKLTLEYLKRRGSIESGGESPPNSSKIKPKKKKERKHDESDRTVSADYSQFFDEDFDVDEFIDAEKGTKLYHDIELVRERKLALRLKNQVTIGELFHRDTFERFFWNPWESMSRQWLTDLPHTLAAMVYPMVQSGSSQSDIEATIRKHLSQTIKAAKSRMIRSLESMVKPRR